ncbi:prolyl oligopeptidase family serine peptidase [Niallia sp. XMNu-256]|uniref:prolyl oligopeptidase family serine peptidase n=1 Tax=Niallia sp. XMNu-256 TaxID=3082444 RepID=UPI0030D31BE1
MILVENKHINGIPSLHLAQKDRYYDQLPLVIFEHGFTSAKEHNLHYAYLLAEKGLRVVLPEAAFHGERSANLDTEQLAFHFWEIVLQSINELDTIRQYFETEKLIDPAKIGLVGTSMGGIVTLGSLTKYEWIKAAASLMGMPSYEKFARWQLETLKKNGIHLPLQQEEIERLLNKINTFDLSKKPEKLNGRPLLFWHGKQDPIVPFNYTYDFYEKIKPFYQDSPGKLLFIVDEKSGHKVSREGLLKTVEWFEQHLA